jgi:hypothetical protein
MAWNEDFRRQNALQGATPPPSATAIRIKPHPV